MTIEVLLFVACTSTRTGVQSPGMPPNLREGIRYIEIHSFHRLTELIDQ
jgi:hypothetical protein